MRATALLFLLLASRVAADQLFSAPERPLLLTGSDGIRLAIVGDANGSSVLRAGLRAVHRSSPLDGIILTGDNFYDCGVSSVEDPQWQKYLKNYSSLGVPLYPVLGNHDYGNPRESKNGEFQICGNPSPAAQIEATGHIEGWSFAARNYVLRGQDVDIVLFDSVPVVHAWERSRFGSATSSETTLWLQETLARSRAAWRIVVAHHIWYSSGTYGTANTRQQRRMRAILPMLVASGADLLISGHDHHLELLDGSTPGRARPLYLVSGAGLSARKIEQRPAGAGPATLFPSLPYEPITGFALLEIFSDCLAITFHDARGLPRGPVHTVYRTKQANKEVVKLPKRP